MTDPVAVCYMKLRVQEKWTKESAAFDKHEKRDLRVKIKDI